MIDSCNMKCYFIEEHHQAFAVWSEHFKESGSASGLLHVDAHPDLTPPVTRSVLNRQQINILPMDLRRKFVEEQLHIGDFVVAGVVCGFFPLVFWLRPDFVGGLGCWCETVEYRSLDEAEQDFAIKCVSRKQLSTGSKNPREYQYSVNKFDYYNFQYSSSPLFPENIILDIELDYFSCRRRPAASSRVEVTEQEFITYNKTPFHYLKLHHNTCSCEEGGRYYIVFNPWQGSEFIQGGDNMESVRRRVDEFILYLSRLKVKPSLVTVCRAVKSGFTPEAYSEYMEALLRVELDRLFVCDFIDF